MTEQPGHEPKPDPSKDGAPDAGADDQDPRHGVFGPSDETTAMDPNLSFPPGSYRVPSSGGPAPGQPPAAPAGPSFSLPNYEQLPYDQPGGSASGQPAQQGYDAGGTPSGYSSPGVPPASGYERPATTYGTPQHPGVYGSPPSAPTSGGYGPPSTTPGGYDPTSGVPSYGTPPSTPTSGGYGSQGPPPNTPGAYGSPQGTPGGYDPTSGAPSYGTPPPTPTSPSYGTPPTYGSPPSYGPSSGAGGYPPPPPPGGYGPSSGTGGYGQAPGYPDPNYGSAAGASAPYGSDPYGMPIPAAADPMAQTAMGVGIASIPLGLLGCCCTPIGILGLIGGIAAVALGLISKKNIAQSGGMKTGGQNATTGIITGAVGTGLGVLILILNIIGVAASFSDSF